MRINSRSASKQPGWAAVQCIAAGLCLNFQPSLYAFFFIAASDVASPRCRSQPTMLPLHLAGLSRGLASLHRSQISENFELKE